MVVILRAPIFSFVKVGLGSWGKIRFFGLKIGEVSKGENKNRLGQGKKTGESGRKLKNKKGSLPIFILLFKRKEKVIK